MSKPSHNRALRGLPFFIAAVTLGFAAACGNKGGGSATVQPPMQAKPDVLAQTELAGTWAPNDERNLAASKRFRGATVRAFPGARDEINVKIWVAMAAEGSEELLQLKGEATIPPMKRVKIAVNGHSDKVFQAKCFNQPCDRILVRLIEKNDSSAPEVEDDSDDNQPKAWTQNVSKYGQVVMIFTRTPKPSEKPAKASSQRYQSTRRETPKATDPDIPSDGRPSNDERPLNLEWSSPSEKGKTGGIKVSFNEALVKAGVAPSTTSPTATKEQQPQGNASNVVDPNAPIKLGENPPAGESAAQRAAREQDEKNRAAEKAKADADREAQAERQRQTDAANAKSRGETAPAEGETKPAGSETTPAT